MQVLAARSSDKRIEWSVDNGRLTEIGPSAPKFTLSATDTSILARLLMESYEDIKNAADKERGETTNNREKKTDETGTTD